MKKSILVFLAVSIGVPVSGTAAAQPFLADEHGPAGVMSDHMHDAGEFMIGYRYMFGQSGSTILMGTHDVDDAALVQAGFATTPTRMRMHMHMLDLMYAPTDWLTLMVMPQYMVMDMTMQPLAGADDGEGHDEGGHEGGHAGPHMHGTEGIGDTVFSALIRLLEREQDHIHAGLGFSAPTGSVSEMDGDGRFTHYMMQLGSGTWDFLPSLTYTGHAGPWGWGTQFGAIIRLEDINDSGFRFGDQYQSSLWASRRIEDWLSASARLLYTMQDSIGGHYNGPHNHGSPPDLQGNYGGSFVEIGLGLNAVVGEGALSGNRLGAEVLLPVHQDVNGFQQERDAMLYLTWSLAM